jgi:hypothetical protein
MIRRYTNEHHKSNSSRCSATFARTNVNRVRVRTKPVGLMPSPTKRQGNGPRSRQVSDTFEGGGTLPRQHSEPISTHKRSVHHRRRDVVSTPSPRFGPPGKLSVSSDSDENSIPAERDAAALESCAHVKQCFVPLFRARSRGLGTPKPRDPQSPYDLLRGLLFLDRQQLKHAHVYLAA